MPPPSPRAHASNRELLNGALSRSLAAGTAVSPDAFLSTVRDELEAIVATATIELGDAATKEHTQCLRARLAATLDWAKQQLERTQAQALRPADGELPNPENSGLLDILPAQAGQRFEQTFSRFERRLSWLISPINCEILDPRENCEQIYHYVAFQFRAELKIFAVLHEIRAAVSLPLANFFLNTGEFSQRGVRRVVDTVLLVCNILEWGFESRRGRVCLARIQEIHQRYTIPNDAMKFVLCGIMFVPLEFNRHFGWRRFTDTERLGWYYAFLKLGRAMGVSELSDSFEETYRWYQEYCQRSTSYGANKRLLVSQILAQVTHRYPLEVRPLIASAFVGAMDDTYLAACGFPRAPKELQQQLSRLFAALGPELTRTRHGLWLQSLQHSSVYPDGYEVEQLGTRRRPLKTAKQVREPLTRAEVRRHARREDLWVIVDNGVYDLTRFIDTHPGGAPILLRYAGTDASEAFAQAPHDAVTRSLMKNYRIGTLAEAEWSRRVLPTRSPRGEQARSASRRGEAATDHAPLTLSSPTPHVANVDLLGFAEAIQPILRLIPDQPRMTSTELREALISALGVTAEPDTASTASASPRS